MASLVSRLTGLAHAAALIAAAVLTLPAAAQVTRCTDPVNGKVTYTDGECAQGEAAREVEARKTPEAIRQEREQAAEAWERKRERQQHEAEQQRAVERPDRPAPQRADNDPSQSVACQRARRNLQEVMGTLGRGMYDEQQRLDAAQREADLACLTPADLAAAERGRANRAVPPYAPPVVVVPPRPGTRPPPPPRPPQREITHCNVFRCYDKQGNTYPR